MKTCNIKLLKPGHTVRAAQLLPHALKTIDCIIFLFERLTLLPDIRCSAMLHHPHTVFSHKLLHFFPHAVPQAKAEPLP